MNTEQQKTLLQELIAECDDLKIVDLVEMGLFDELNGIDSDPSSKMSSWIPSNGIPAKSSKWSRFQYDVSKYFLEFKDEQTQKFKTEFDALSKPDSSIAGPWIWDRKIDRIKVLLENMMTDLKYAPIKKDQSEEKKEHEQYGSSVTIGNNNKISRVIINQNVNDDGAVKSQKEHKIFFERHPWISGILCSIIAGVIMLFGFWTQIIEFVESLFK